MSDYWDDAGATDPAETVPYSQRPAPPMPREPSTPDSSQPAPLATDTRPANNNRPEYASVPLLIAAAIMVGFSALLLLVDGVWWHLIGYLFGTVLTIGLITVFRRDDMDKRSRATYVPRPALSAIAIGIIVVGFLVAVVHVWALATEWSR